MGGIGDTSTVVDTVNPSNDDNIFVAALFAKSVAAVVGPLPPTVDLKPVLDAIARLEVKADKLEVKADRIEAALGLIEGAVGRIESTVNSTNSIVGLNNLALGLLEAKADKLEGKADRIEAALGELERKADLLEMKIDDHASQTSNINETLKSLVRNIVAMKRVELQVVEVKEGERFLLATSEAGMPVKVTLTTVNVAGTNPVATISFNSVPFVATAIAPGVLDFTVSLPKPLHTSNMFQFQVEHDHGIDIILGPVKHHGRTVLHIESHNNLGTGQ